MADLPPHFLTPGVRARLLAAATKPDAVAARALRVVDLAPGDAGVLDVVVVDLDAPRTFTRRDGGQGRLQRVRLADATGEVPLVLWGGDIDTHRDVLQPGAAVRIAGALVKDGYRGGVELGLAGTRIEPLPPAAGSGELVGRVVAVGATRIVGEPPNVRFNADVTVSRDDGGDADADVDADAGADRRGATVVVWDDAIKAAHAARVEGGTVRVAPVRPHPVLEGWFLGDDATIASA